MARLKDTSLTLFLTRGASLRMWADVGMLDRELALYVALRPYVKGVTLVSYGDSRDRRYMERLDGIRLVCNRWGVHRRLYARALPYVYPLTWRGPSIAKSNQVPGADVALRAARLAGKKFVARCGYLYSEFMARANGEGSPKAAYARSLERRVFTAADRVVVTTEAMRSSVMAAYRISEQRVAVIPNYVETEWFRPMPEVRRHPKRICFVGRLHPQKNLFALLEAIEGQDVELVVVGNGDLKAGLSEFASSRGLSVRFAGNLPHRQLPALLNESALFVLPSLYEGHPKTLLEAMACGLPVVGTRVPGIQEIIRHKENGYLSGTSPGEMRDAIQAVMADHGLRARMGSRAREFVVERFALPRIVDLELAVLEELAAS